MGDSVRYRAQIILHLLFVCDNDEGEKERDQGRYTEKEKINSTERKEIERQDQKYTRKQKCYPRSSHNSKRQ